MVNQQVQRVRLGYFMRRLLILPLFLGVSLPVQAGVDPEVHKLCKDVKDYVGCVQMMSGGATTSEKTYQVNKFGYRKYKTFKGGSVEIHPQSIKAKKIRNKYGRYLTFFVDRTKYFQPTSGYSSPGYQTPSYATTTIYGNTARTTITGGQTYGGINIPSTPGGIRFKGFPITADCIDYTFDAKDDGQGWLNVRAERPDSAKGIIGQILDEFCPQMDLLVKED